MTTRRYCGGRFVADVREHSRPLKSNERARIMMRAQELECDTKAKGRVNGVLGWPGLRVLNALLFKFHNRTTGLTCPSYDALETATGLCREAVARGVKRLVAAGILDKTRRLVRETIYRGGVPLKAVRQASNLYAMREPPEWAWLIPVPPLPSPGASAAQTSLRSPSYSAGPSLRDREKPT